MSGSIYGFGVCSAKSFSLFLLKLFDREKKKLLCFSKFLSVDYDTPRPFPPFTKTLHPRTLVLENSGLDVSALL